MNRYPCGRNTLDLAINDAVAFRIFAIALSSLTQGWGYEQRLFWNHYWLGGFRTGVCHMHVWWGWGYSESDEERKMRGLMGT
jgi:hypothetical protein